MSKLFTAGGKTIYAFESPNVKYDLNDKLKISTLRTRTTNIAINGKTHKVVIFCRHDMAVKNLKSDKHSLSVLKKSTKKTTRHLTNFFNSVGKTNKEINFLLHDIKTPHTLLNNNLTAAENKILRDAVFAQNGDPIDGKELTNKEVIALCNQAKEIKYRNFFSSKTINYLNAENFLQSSFVEIKDNLRDFSELIPQPKP